MKYRIIEKRVGKFSPIYILQVQNSDCRDTWWDDIQESVDLKELEDIVEAKRVVISVVREYDI